MVSHNITFEMNRMNKATSRDIKIEIITGEVYYDYTDYSGNKIDTRFQRIASWLSKRVDDQSERLSSLRVYDHKRIDG